MPEFHQPPPLSLYVHLPWCVRKCPYCDFNSHGVGTGPIAANDYVDALIRDLRLELPRIRERQIMSVFFGGGTPSLFPARSIDRLLGVLRCETGLSADAEITLEANPGTAEAGRFRDYRAAGINRLSLGVQSFDDRSLAALGRIHDGAEASAAVDMAIAAGFDNFNIDLMFGLPGQDVAAALRDVQAALACEPPHLSWYQLTIEPNTAFYSSPPVLPDEDRIWAMQQQGGAVLEAAGLQRYEISAFSRPGRRCRHNLNYWEFGDYLGIGAGAHGKLTDVDSGVIRRFARHRLPARYLELAGSGEVIVEQRELGEDDLVIEFMMNACRLRDGFPETLFTDRTGLAPGLLADGIAQAEARGMLRAEAGRLVPSDSGMLYLNDLLQCFMSPSAGAPEAPLRVAL